MEFFWAVLWYASGLGSYIFWWTKDWDLTEDDLWLGLFASLFGPICFLVGWLIHSDLHHEDEKEKKPKVLMTKRKY